MSWDVCMQFFHNMVWTFETEEERHNLRIVKLRGKAPSGDPEKQVLEITLDEGGTPATARITEYAPPQPGKHP